MVVMEVLTLNGTNFDETILNALPVIVDFYADWCGPCKRVAPIITQLAKENEGKIIFCKLNVDDCPEIAARYSIQSIPALISFKNGKVHKTMVGVQSSQKILELAD